jgi:alkylation response protein AidB-like acyl-CoA dehydrogenase
MMSLVADELVATMGGYGYVEEYPAERFYRDARINESSRAPTKSTASSSPAGS